MGKRIPYKLDHHWHNCALEWLYFWGRLDTGEFFHFAEFVAKLGGARVNSKQWSIDGNYFEEIDGTLAKVRSSCGYADAGFYFNTPQLGLTFKNIPRPIPHRVGEAFNYYSIPFMQGEGYLYPKPIKAVAWLDHEWTENPSDVHIENWDWVGLHLDCGISIMAYLANDLKVCDLSFNGTSIDTNFILEGRHLFLYSTGMYLMLDPILDERVFNPKFGTKYSEQPISIISKGGVIGYGMRERTYGNK